MTTRIPDADQAGGPLQPPPDVRGRLHGWRHPAILSAAGLSVMAGFSQFAVTAALPDVAAAFGEVDPQGPSLAAQAGLSLATLGVGLGVVRLASLAALPLAGLGDRFGRRRVVLACAAAGLTLTVASAASPTFWWFIAIVALGRPMLSATNALATVIAAEETRTTDRAWAIALITAGYGIGAGITALLRGAFGTAMGFRQLFGLAAIPLVGLVLVSRFLEEPARFDRLRAAVRAPSPLQRWGKLSAETRRRFRVVAVLTFSISFLTGPVNTFLFLFAENVLSVSRGTTAVLVIAAAPLGALGLLTGRALADRLGRVPSAAVAHCLLGVAGMVTYSGRVPAAVGGYLASILFGSVYAPSGGAISTELFPTGVRATVQGALTAIGVLGAVSGLVAFGQLGDAMGSFALAAVVVAVPVLAATPLYFRLPETRELELEQSAAE